MNSSFRHLEAAAAESNIEALERHRETASTLTKALSDFLLAQANNTDDIHHWHQELVRLSDGDQVKPPETLIMVVGSMGAGKSTAINGLIDEARLLPTSGYDACTSVATEVRYNHSTDPDEAYRAEITFITEEELLNELLILREDVLSTSEAAGSSSAGTAADYDDNSHAEVAWDKIQAVWPRLTRAELAAPDFDIHVLLEDDLIRVCLGETRQVCHSTAAGLCRYLERFIANRDNAALAKRAEGVGAEQQYWPLVDKVNIFVKAEPGGQDGNSASEQIVKKPFNDASTFKNWIKFDGRLDRITYVCTMTDDAIEIDGDAEEFGLGEHLDEARQLEQELDACDAALAGAREQLDALQVRSQLVEDTVGSWMKSAGDKRKRSVTSETVREKRLRRNPLPSPPEWGSYTAKLDMETTEEPVEMLTSNLETEVEELGTRIQHLETECENLQRQLMQHNLFLKESCIQARNTLTRSAIGRDFVHAAKELLSRQGGSESSVTDQELDDENKREPVPPMVHTVSVRGYFESLKRHRNEQFWAPNTVELSGIPAWRDHIKELTEPARRRKCQAFLRAVLRCFNHMAIWCDNGSGMSLTSEQEKEELARYRRDLDSGVKRLGFHFDVFVDECRDVFDRLFSERVRTVLPKVIGSAIEVASTWPSRKRGDKLLTASSYRSACRKGGIYEGKGHAHKNPWNLNKELSEPLLDEIDYQCGNAFEKLLPAAFKDLKAKSAQVIYELSEEADRRMQPSMTDSARQKLRLQARSQIESIHDAVEDMRMSLTDEDTRGYTRNQLESALKIEMRQTWKECVKTTGAGSFQRQQAIVERHIRDKGAEMYTCASSRVERILRSRCVTMGHTLQNLKRSVYRDMWHAYTTSIVAKDDGNRAAREELHRLLVEADGHFQTS
ncbi:hypothetical protein INS49_010115 [Diaporthe citri]|uniref:uncharacterized protein n=1 Tax=Diaporthe citri TaxID=83186 RepID=UPI001C81242D|nr:uncharacterized protein INS49_010115 [Diaporthe citri]KAG6361886.1 hypothetical protein INS49_010115 [Diaporthe citri]